MKSGAMCAVLLAVAAIRLGAIEPVESPGNARLDGVVVRSPFGFEPAAMERSVFTGAGESYSVRLSPGLHTLTWHKGDEEFMKYLTDEESRIELRQAQPDSPARGLDPYTGKAVRIVRDGRRFTSRLVPVFREVQFENVYPGVDLICRAGEGKLQYWFVGDREADLSAIALKLSGAGKMKAAPDGGVIFSTPAARVRVHPPLLAAADGELVPSLGRFVVGRGRVALFVRP